MTALGRIFEPCPGAGVGVFPRLSPSGALHCAYPVQIQSQAHELELGAYPVQSPHAELAEPQHVLDPAVGWLGNPLAFSVG